MMTQKPNDQEKQALVAALETYLAGPTKLGPRMTAGYAQIRVSLDGGKTFKDLGEHWIEMPADPEK